MSLEVRVITDANVWDDFVKKSPLNNFMQSWGWSEYQERGLERKTYRLGFFKDEELVAVSACYEQSQTFGKFIYCSRGPILKVLASDLYKEVLEALKNYFESSEYVFIKIDPALEESNAISTIPFDIGFKKSINYVQPETPWMIDLVGNTEEELLAWCKEHGMNKNYPTYIRKARKEGVTVHFSNDRRDWEEFTKYLSKSSEDKNFAIRSSSYYTKQFEYMGESGLVRLAIAKYNSDPIVMLVMSCYGDEVSCLYSAQTGLHTKLRGAMLVRWESMLKAQSEGFKRFNSWSVLPNEKYKPGNSQYGYSNFKRGFGGYLIKYQRTADYPIKKGKYFLVRLLDMYRKIRYYSDR